MAPLAPVRERRRGRREDEEEREEARKTSGGRRAGQSTCTPLAPRDMSEPPPSACNWTCTCPTTTGAHAAEERTSEEEERRIGKSRWQIHNGARKRQTWSRARGAGACQERPARAQCASSSSWTAPTDTS
ncbi:unnamed protein product [Prorocentrum cordatum]|uniref:Uncharacterized protein n=1 Tax=Prorocentrum cordatum TaxID=2364126 RepID=A0ABN9VYX5_9DINO|nr:unnamed protein product [Polarella glacialis]